MMPVIPFVGDDEAHLEPLVRATKDHGGSCLLGGGLTMDGPQAERTLEAARRMDPQLEPLWKMYRWEVGGGPQYGPLRSYNAHLGLLVRELCAKHGLSDRMPRHILPGPLAVNKRVAERLFSRPMTSNWRGQVTAASGPTARQPGPSMSRSRAWLRSWPPKVRLDCKDARVGRSLARQIATWLREEEGLGGQARE